MSRIHVIVNPAAGGRISERLFQEQIEPRLAAKKRHFEVYRTQSSGDGARIAPLIRSSMGMAEKEAGLALVLVGGDGTTHEVVNGLMGQVDKEGKYAPPPRTKIAIVPAGTANALYASLFPPKSQEGGADESEGGDEDAWRMKSLDKMLNSDDGGANGDHLYPLALASVTTKADNGTELTTLAHLITSHALHASILADSESLRAEHPGIERFKMAAEQNVTVWTRASLKLRPLASSTANTGSAVLRYDPYTRHFVEEEDKEGSSTLEGPFVYAACLSTDRLEPHFVPGPYSGPAQSCPGGANMARPEDALDLLLVRPCRDPTLQQVLEKQEKSTKALEGQDWSGDDTAEMRIQFAQKRLVPMMMNGMYGGGKHVNFTFPSEPDGDLGEVKEGQIEDSSRQVVICEYIRCGGYEWIPAQDDAKAKRTCIDGTVLEAQQNTAVRVVTKEEGAGCILVYL